MQDVIWNAVQQIALVAHHDQARAIGLDEDSSHSAASRSRWLDGSSSSSRSGSENSSAASATRMRQPPENVSSGRCCASSSKPRPARMRAARAGAPWASMASAARGSRRCDGDRLRAQLPRAGSFARSLRRARSRTALPPLPALPARHSRCACPRARSIVPSSAS